MQVRHHLRNFSHLFFFIMKKFLLILFVMANFLSISAQEKIGEYELSYFPKDTFDIYADVSNDGDFTYFIFGESKDLVRK